MTGWVEVMPVRKLSAKVMLKFILNWVYRFGLMIRAVVNGGPEMKGILPRILSDLGVRRIQISAYHPQANASVEVGHFSLISGIAKIAVKRNGKWLKILDLAVLADRVAVKSSTGKSAFYLIHGWELILPIEVKAPTWRLINWDSVTT